MRRANLGLTWTAKSDAISSFHVHLEWIGTTQGCNMYHAGRQSTRGRSAGYRVSLVIPAWNEEAAIGRALDEAVAALSLLADEYEVIVVDDGSTDRTAEIVQQRAVDNPRVRCIRHELNRGYGAALRSGFEASQHALVAFTDADCQFELSDLRYMLPLAEHYEIVCGARIDRQDPALRRIYSWGYNTLIRLLLGSPVHDVDCALKLFGRQRLMAILPESKGFFVNAEMLSRAHVAGASIVEVGVRHRPRCGGQSKVSLAAIPKTLDQLLPFWWTRTLFPAQTETTKASSVCFWWGLLALALVAGLQLFAHLDYQLFEPDEGRYAEIGREMLVSGQWIVPTLHHEPYFDKPPLLYWLLAGSFACFGTDDWAARLVPASATWLTTLATYLFASRALGTRAAFLAGLVMSFSLGFVHAGRFLVFDSLLTLWVTLSLLAGYEALRGPRLKWGWWLASAVCCGLGCLTKGPVALALLAPPVLAHQWLNGSPCRLRLPHCLAHLALTGMLAAPWFVAMVMAQPDFAYSFIWEHHLGRFLTGSKHPEPGWYYAPVLLIGGFPCTLLMLPWARYQFSRHPHIASTRTPLHGFFLLWAGWCLAFFSLSSCKLPAYIMPAGPALAVLSGNFLDQLLARRMLWPQFRWQMRVLPVCASTVMCVAWVIVVWGAWATGIETLWEALAESLLCLAILSVTFSLSRNTTSVAAWAVCCALVLCFTFEAGRDLVPGLASSRSPLPSEERLASMVNDPHTPLIVFGRDWGSVPFYLGRDDVRRYDTSTLDNLAELLRNTPRALILARTGTSVHALAGGVPANRELRRVGSAGRAGIWIVESTRQASHSKNTGSAAAITR